MEASEAPRGALSEGFPVPVCPKCQAAFPDGTGTCQFDGTTLVTGAVCPTCSLEHAPGSTQCRICGGRLERALIGRAGEAPRPSAPAGPPAAVGAGPIARPVAGGVSQGLLAVEGDQPAAPPPPPLAVQATFGPVGGGGAWPVTSGPVQPPPPVFGASGAPAAAAAAPPGFGPPQYAAAPAGLRPPSPYGAPMLPPPPMGYGYDPNSGMVMNTSGSGGGAVPDEIRYLGWNWGAFLMTPLWSICHRSWMGLLGMLPCVGLVISIMYGINGNVYAWQSRHFESIEQFRDVQRKWAWAGLVVACISVVLNVLQMVAAMHAQQGSLPPGVGM